MTREERIAKFQTLEQPKWKRLKINGLSFPTESTYDLAYTDNSLVKEGALITNSKGSIHPKVAAHNEAYTNVITSVDLDGQVIPEPIKLDFVMTSDQPYIVDQHRIRAVNGSKATIIYNYRTEDDVTAFHNGITEVSCDSNSHITIIKLYHFNHNSVNLDANHAHEGRDSKVSTITVDLSRGLSVTSRIDDLVEQGASTDHRHIYFAKGSSKHDHLYHLNHYAPYGESEIDVRGAMMDEARKVFRGTIDFKKGSRKSKSCEKEYVLLLNEGLTSHAIPALICDEDDVEGEHAASAGQIDENQLFYLMSRGFSLIDAKRLLIESNFRPIIEAIPDENLKEVMLEQVLKGLIV